LNKPWGEIGDPEHARAVLLQEHHITAGAVESLPLLNAPLQGALAPVPLLAGEAALQVQQQRLGFELWCLLEQPLRGSLRLRHQHVLPHVRQGISARAPLAPALLLLSLALQFTAINALSTTHGDANRISSDLLAQATGPFGHGLLLDPQRQRDPRFQERCHPFDQYTRGLEDMTNASLQRGCQS